MRAIRVGVVCLGVLVLACSGSRAQDAALRDRVQQLVGRLDAEEEARRQEAEAALVELGSRVLPLLPEVTNATSEEAAKRLGRVRAALEEAGAAVDLGATMVTIEGEGIRLSEAIQQLQKQTGNVVTDLREQLGQEAGNPALDLEIKERPFFEAFDLICEKAGVVPYFFTGDGSVGLMAREPMMGGQQVSEVEPGKWVSYSGPFRVALQEVVVKRELVSGRHVGNARLEIAWEPRLRPMLLKLASSGLKIKDDRGREVAPALEEEATGVPILARNPMVELNLNMSAPERDAQTLAEVKVSASMTLPGGSRMFNFADATKPDKQTRGKMSVELVSAQVEDFVWKFRLMVSQPAEAGGLDSYQQGLMNNQIWLQRADGSRFEHNGGFSNLGEAEGKVGFEYLFVDAPGKPSDYRLVYEAPTEVVEVPLEFELRDVPLP